MKESGLAMTDRQLVTQVDQCQRNPATRSPTLRPVQEPRGSPTEAISFIHPYADGMHGVLFTFFPLLDTLFFLPKLSSPCMMH